MLPLRVALLYTALSTLVLAPILSVDNLGLGDYLNHLARMHILASIATSPDLQRFYQLDWQPIPYLAMDAIVPLLARIMPLYAAGKCFVCACILLPPAAAACVQYAVHRRVGLIPAAAFLLSYNYLLCLGFLNYLFSASWAVILFAAWIAAGHWPRWPRAAIFAPFVTLLYFGHAFACAAYCLAVAAHELTRAKFSPPARAQEGGAHSARNGRVRAGPTQTYLRSLAQTVPPALAQAIPAIAFAATLNLKSAYNGPLQNHYGTLADKLLAFAAPILFQPNLTNIAVLAGCLALAALAALSLRLPCAIWPAIVLIALVALAVPHLMASTWGTDLRLPFVAALLAIGGAYSVRTGRVRAGAITLLTLLVVTKSADAWITLHATSRDIAETRDILANLPRGARLLVVNLARGTYAQGFTPSTRWHEPLIATIDHDAFLPTLFTGLSTVHVRPEYRAASTPNGFPITTAQLTQGLTQLDTQGKDLPDGPGGGRLYHLGWPEKFDYVLVQSFGLQAGVLPSILQQVAHTPNLDLYVIRRRPGDGKKAVLF